MKIVFMGTPDFAVGTLDAIRNKNHEILLCVTQPDRERGRGKKVSFSPVKEYANKYDIPVFQPERIKEESAIDELKKYEADVFIVAAFGQILPKEILSMPRLGCINVHASLLPKYRGAAPIQWAILNGDKETGITIMKMGEGLDDGNILYQEKIPIDEKETGGSLFKKLEKMGGEVLVKTLDLIIKNEIKETIQDESLATKVSMIKKEMGRIDFNDPAIKTERKIRALNPWPSAYTRINKKTVKIISAEVLNENKEGASSGEIVKADKTGLYIQTGSGILKVLKLQPEGKKEMDFNSFLNGNKIEEHTVL